MLQSKTIRNEGEVKEFIACLGNQPEAYEVIYGRDVIIQGNIVTEQHLESSVIGVFSGFNDYRPPNRKAGVIIEIINIPEELAPQLQKREACKINRPLEGSHVIEYKHGNTTIAVVDTLNNIFFMDFYHANSEPFSIFEWVLDDFTGKNPRETYLDSFEKTIRTKIDANKICKIEITHEFDKDFFIEEGKKEIEKTIRTERQIAETRVEGIQRLLNSERASVDKRIKDSDTKSFLEGLKFLKDGWVVKDNRLVYDKDIPMKSFTYKDKAVSAPSGEFFTRGLSITIAPNVTGAVADTGSKHPNINADNVCIGDLNNKPLKEFMEKIVKEMEVGNLNSPWDTNTADKGYKLFRKELGIPDEIPLEEWDMKKSKVAAGSEKVKSVKVWKV